jgi:Cd2+/Zn2+-exporting ATPase
MAQAIDIVSEHRLGSPGDRSAWIFSPRGELAAALFAGVLLALGYVLHVWLKLPATGALVWASLAIGMVYGGRAAWAALRQRKFDIDVLMVVGAALAAYIGHPEEGALLLVLFVLAGALEDLAMQRTKREVEALHTLMPTDALVLREGAWIEADAKSLIAGETVKVRPGERVPADARVTQGETSMDQSAMTGESLPRHVRPGDELYAGTINTDDPIEAVVLRPVAQSSLQRILDLVTKAREQREPVQRAIDRLSEPYAWAVLLVSILVFLLWWKGLERTWEEALQTAITLLIVASPCALVISTPTATLAAIARGARGGVLFKGGQSIEQLAGMGAVCFDKTGTLTFGRPRLYEAHPVAWSDGHDLLALAAGLEADSTHPIAVAIKEAAAQREIRPAILESVNHTAGRGLEGLHAGVPVRLGSYPFAEEFIPACLRGRVKEVLARIQERGHIAVVVARRGTSEHGGEAAVLIMADSVRPGAATLVQRLHELGVRPVRMLTGDNRLTAARVAESLHLDAFDAELLPKDKLDIVHAMKQERKARPGSRGVGVIGDGVNDAPALAAADVSLAIGAIGTAAALESADIVLLSDDLGTVPWALDLARRARRTVKGNLTLALAVILVMGLVTLVGSWRHTPLPLFIGVLAHEGGTLLVVLNSLLLLRFPGLHAQAPRAPRPVPMPLAPPAPA